MRCRAGWAAAVGLALVLTGCATADMGAPTCDDEGRNMLVLVAQSVPDAEFVPCLDALPADWTMLTLDIKSGETRMQLAANRADGPPFVTMAFLPSCDVGAAVEVPSDRKPARRFEDVADVEDGYQGTRYYTFEGGCVRYAFNVRGDGWSALVNDTSTAFALESRAALERYIRDYSNGVIEHL